jgi:hypothetical protein
VRSICGNEDVGTSITIFGERLKNTKTADTAELIHLSLNQSEVVVPMVTGYLCER